MTTPNADYGPHPTHCCGRHGCKYGDDDCPVTVGTVQQEVPCHRCVSPEEARQELALALDEFAWSCALFGRLFPDRVRTHIDSSERP